MAFTTTILGETYFGNKRVTYGSWATDTTGGNLDTGLVTVDMIVLQHSGNAVVASAPSINETLPYDGSAITIVVTSGADGYWWAMGY